MRWRWGCGGCGENCDRPSYRNNAKLQVTPHRQSDNLWSLRICLSLSLCTYLVLFSFVINILGNLLSLLSASRLLLPLFYLKHIISLYLHLFSFIINILGTLPSVFTICLTLYLLLLSLCYCKCAISTYWWFSLYCRFLFLFIWFCMHFRPPAQGAMFTICHSVLFLHYQTVIGFGSVDSVVFSNSKDPRFKLPSVHFSYRR